MILGLRTILFATTAVWGLNLTVVKLLTAHVDTLMLATLRTALATLALSCIVWFRPTGMSRLRRDHWIRIAVCAVFMVYGNQIFFVSGMQLSSATNAALVVALSPMAALVVASIVLGERLRRASVTGVLIGFAGVAAVILARSGADLSTSGVGDLLVLLSVASFALGGAVVQRLAQDLEPMSLSWAIHLLGSILLLVHMLVTQAGSLGAIATLTMTTWGLLLFSGAVATGLGSLVWNMSISAIGVGRTTSALYWVPIFGVGFAVVALGESLSIWHPIGLVAVLTGTWITSRSSSSH